MLREEEAWIFLPRVIIMVHSLLYVNEICMAYISINMEYHL